MRRRNQWNAHETLLTSEAIKSEELGGRYEMGGVE